MLKVNDLVTEFGNYGVKATWTVCKVTDTQIVIKNPLGKEIKLRKDFSIVGKSNGLSWYRKQTDDDVKQFLRIDLVRSISLINWDSIDLEKLIKIKEILL